MLKPLQLHDELPISNIDLFNGDTLASLQSYYALCSKATDLMVTTSCFAEWKKGKSTNGSAKVIPAVPAGHKDRGKPIRVFFFDDNINLSLGTSSGSADTKGICNLRDINTGKYVDFSVGANGFQCDEVYRHTLIHYSSEYQNVLVQANILDAMTNVDYFTRIIAKYAKKGEKFVVFMDVNGTILWNDSIMGYGPHEILLGTMFNFTEVRPRKSFELAWEQQPTVKVEKTQMLKQLINDIASGDNDVLHAFWKRDVCEKLIARIRSSADIGWAGQMEALSSDDFFSVHKSYMDSLKRQEQQGVPSSGITTSWFQCLRMLQRGSHSAVINSFGMDTHKVVLRSARDARRVPHIAVNFESWSERDTSKFREQFQAEALPPPPPRFLGCGGEFAVCHERGCQGDRVCTNASENLILAQDPDYVFEYVVRKPSPDMTLGAKVTHIDGVLEVTQIFPGAIESANAVNKTMTPPGETIRIGDRIREVNSITRDTKAMVEECKRGVNIAMVVARPPRLVNQMGWCEASQSDPFDEEILSPLSGGRKAGRRATWQVKSPLKKVQL